VINRDNCMLKNLHWPLFQKNEGGAQKFDEIYSQETQNEVLRRVSPHSEQ
jgi:hypothetical protein